MKNKIICLVSEILILAIILCTLPVTSIVCDASTESYLYTIFAASEEEGAIILNSSNSSINGHLATNGTVRSKGNMNINGAKIENAEKPIIYIFDKIDTQFFARIMLILS